jgi:hypothetical protein
MRINMVTRRTATKKPAPVPEIEDIEELDVDELDIEEEEEPEPKPAPKRRTPAARKPAARKKAPSPEPVDDDDEEDDEPEPAPAAKKRGRPAKSATAEPKPKPAPKRPEVEFGTQWLVNHVNEACGTSYKPYDLRVLLRKMAKNNELDREVGSDRSRYSFTGPDDAVVKAVVKNVQSGAVENEKKAALDKLKERTAAKEPAATGNVTPIKKRGRPAKPKPAPVDEEEYLDDDDVEELD